MERKNRWKFYNNAIIPVCPEKDRFEEKLSYSKIVKEWRGSTGEKKKPLFCLYPTDFDCGYETEWWYNIKDSVWDIGLLNAKHRNKITHARRLFTVEQINPLNYIEKLYEVLCKAYSAYPEKYRPSEDFESFKNGVQASALDYIWYGAFYKETNELVGFRRNQLHKNVLIMAQQKVMPEFEKYKVNYVLIDFFLESFNQKIVNDRTIITNGQRNLAHETEYNKLLEHFFGFRKAYCKLNIKFHPLIVPVVKILYICTPPHWKKTEFRTENPILYKISLILKYMRIEKECKKQCKINNKS